MTDVVVVGGGILGGAIAASCASRGRRVVLCERAALASGASDLPLALVPSGPGATRYLALHHFTGGSFLLDRSPPDDWPARRIDPRAATAALAAEARSHRAAIRTGCDVKALLVRRDAVVGVLTDDGTLEARTVVVAAGAGSAALCATAGVRLPSRREEMTIAVAEPPSGFGEAPLVEGDGWAALDAAGRLVVSGPERLGLEVDLSWRRRVELETREDSAPDVPGLVVAPPPGRWGIAEAPRIAKELAERIANGRRPLSGQGSRR